MRQMGTKPHIGTAPSGLRKALDLLGVNFIETENATMSDMKEFLRKRLPVIVAWNYENDGHYSVISDLRKDGIMRLIEPYRGKVIRMSTPRFLKLWRDPCNGTNRWMLALGTSKAP